MPREIFPDQGSNPHLLHWQPDSLPLSHLGTLRESLNLGDIQVIRINHFKVNNSTTLAHPQRWVTPAVFISLAGNQPPLSSCSWSSPTPTIVDFEEWEIRDGESLQAVHPVQTCVVLHQAPLPGASCLASRSFPLAPATLTCTSFIRGQ